MNLQEKVSNIDKLSNEELVELLKYTRKLCGYSAREFGMKAKLSHATLLGIEQGGKITHKSRKKVKDGILICLTKYQETYQDTLKKLLSTDNALDNELKALSDKIASKKILIDKCNELLKEINKSLSK